MSDFRLYLPDECGPDEYPRAWHETIKHVVRDEAGHRCQRCGHPYRQGEHGRGEWSPCDEACTHGGPGRRQPDEVDHRAAVPEGYPPIVSEDGWVHFDDAAFEWLVEHGMEPEARYRILTVHHLNGVKADCRWWNLCALCQRCHLSVQSRVHLEQVYPFEHSDWFKLHAAGYYAFVYLDKDITREQAEDHLDEFLALERAT